MNIYEIRKAGREYCQTEGGEHYKGAGVEPIEQTIAEGNAEGFCIGSIRKYTARFKKTQNLNDLKKISDYAHILCGVKLSEMHEIKIPAMSQEVQQQLQQEITTNRGCINANG